MYSRKAGGGVVEGLGVSGRRQWMDFVDDAQSRRRRDDGHGWASIKRRHPGRGTAL